jgi:hypothetical protein
MAQLVTRAETENADSDKYSAISNDLQNGEEVKMTEVRVTASVIRAGVRLSYSGLFVTPVIRARLTLCTAGALAGCAH